MYLLILESIGTSELLLIGLVALIIFGPRKLPDMMRTFGKAMAEFRKSTNEFKQSWEKEVDLESMEKEALQSNPIENELDNTIGRKSFPVAAESVVPEIKEINSEDFERAVSKAETRDTENSSSESASLPKQDSGDLSAKRDWL